MACNELQGRVNFEDSRVVFDASVMIGEDFELGASPEQKLGVEL